MMLTPLTQTALAVLNDIAYGETVPCSPKSALSKQTVVQLLVKLELHGLICRQPDRPTEELLSYQLARPVADITLLDILEATGEHLNCNREIDEHMYHQYGVAVHKLGVINRITRQFLSEIRLTEL